MGSKTNKNYKGEKNNMEKETIKILETMGLHGIIAFVGGAVHYLTKAEQPTLIKILISGIIGSFAGVLFGLLASAVSDSQYVITAIAGIGGYAGKEGLDWLFSLLKRTVNKRTK